MKADKEIYVLYGDRTVGTLAMASSYQVAFEYSDEWLNSGFAACCGWYSSRNVKR